MEINEIKKLLYQQKPLAEFMGVSTGGIQYCTNCPIPGVDSLHPLYFYFLIPLSEIGDTFWKAKMPAQLLIRYLVNQ